MSASGWSALLSLVVAIVVLAASFLQWWEIGFDGALRTYAWVKRLFVVLIAVLVVAAVLLVVSEAHTQRREPSATLSLARGEPMTWQTKLTNALDESAGEAVGSIGYASLRDALFSSFIDKPGLLIRVGRGGLREWVPVVAKEIGDEEVHAAAIISRSPFIVGLIALTPTRLVTRIEDLPIMEGDKPPVPVVVRSRPLSEIVAVHEEAGRVTHDGIVIEFAFGEKETFKLPHSRSQPFVVAINKAVDSLARPQPVAGAAEASPSSLQIELVEELERLAALRDNGLLNAEEFAAAKAKLLGL